MTNLMTLQSMSGFPYREQDADQAIAGAPNFYGAGDSWNPSSNFNIPIGQGPFTLDPFQQGQQTLSTNTKHMYDMASDAQQQAYVKNASKPGANLTLTTSQQYPSHSMFTPTNVQTTNSQNVPTISPMQTRFNHDNLSATSTASFPFAPQTQTSSPTQQKTSFSKEHHNPSAKRRRDSIQSAHDQSSPTSSSSSGGRRRRSEHAEPGSARAIYLEKNRKAASKCRSKQKMQQEELVETARDVERRNRALKAEVEFLKGGMRDLMEIVGQHSTCPDGRLRSYVQREADRLATHGFRSDQKLQQPQQQQQHSQQQQQHQHRQQLQQRVQHSYSSSSSCGSPDIPPMPPNQG